MTTLKEIMTEDVFTTARDAPVVEAAASMLRGGFGSAVVMQGPMLIGIFTERDVLRAAAAGADPTASRVSDWMTADPVTGDPDMDANEVAELMMTQGFRHLPVVEANELVGMVSLRDILRARVRRPQS